MKKAILLSVSILVIFQISAVAQIKVNSSGLVGINNSNPTYRLDISGNVKMTYNGYTLTFSGDSFNPSSNMNLGGSSNFWYRLYANTAYLTNQPVITSDERFKINVKNLDLMTDRLKLLRPVTYNFNPDDPKLASDPLINKVQFGFLAQELQKVFPEMVVQREDGTLGITYSELIPVLVQALKEQQDQIDGLNKRIADLESKIK
ncbi:MAG TPA: tail fiber domain-containing protein [Bacteroidales bacterium]|nr:tail fiber domain-containing protein [Bacteroidales bacterium]